MRLDKYLKLTRLIKRRTVANDACDAGKITVTGLMQLANDLEPGENGRINAAYYTTTSEGATYHNYTNFVDAVAANPATVYIYGEVTVLEDVTVPSPMVIRNEGTLIIGSTENRDVTVTVANGASFRSGTVKVLGTMYFENKRNVHSHQQKSQLGTNLFPNGTIATFTIALMKKLQ